MEIFDDSNRKALNMFILHMNNNIVYYFMCVIYVLVVNQILEFSRISREFHR